MAKFDVGLIPTKKKRATIKPLRIPTELEKELLNFNSFMIKTINNRFKNKVLKQLDKNTISKFSDAQAGNYSKVLQKLTRDFKKSINNQFGEDRIKKYVAKLYKRTNNINDKKFYQSVSKELGVDVKQIIKTDGLNSFINAKTLETTLQILKLKNEAVENLSQNTLRLMSAGKSLSSLYEEVTIHKKRNLHKAELVARNELKTFNQQLSDKRAKNIGVQKAIWNTVGDERTRKCHKARDGMEYDLDKGLYHSCDGKHLKAGEEINCRCYATYVVKFD